MHQSQFARPFTGDSFQDFLGLPARHPGRGRTQGNWRSALLPPRSRDRAIIWALGGHVIKTGLAPLLIQLLKEEFVTAIATNGSVIIHDFEIAYCGSTSEDVEKQLGSGAFGMARETGQFLNEAINRGADQDTGIGEAVGRYLSVLCARSSLTTPWSSRPINRTSPLPSMRPTEPTSSITTPVPVAPSLGKCTEIDYRIFTQEVSRLHDGGVFINVGSAVLLPEVFLKAVSAVRNRRAGTVGIQHGQL